MQPQMDTKNTKPKTMPEMPFPILEQTKKETKMKTQKEMWKDINEPKVEKIIPIFDENGKLVTVVEQLDRIPIWWVEEMRENGENPYE